VPLRVLHLAGSAVSGFHADLSRVYAADCLQATADPARYEFHVAYITPDRRWRFPEDLSPAAIEAAPPMPITAAVDHLRTLHLDVVVPQMFCLPGMTHYRALLDLLDIPYVGNTPDVMAVTAHKARAKAIVAAAGVRVPPGELLRAGQTPSIEPPAVVKPVDSDNSVGVTLVRHRGEYDSALRAAFDHADEALVETLIPLGREVRCGIVVQDTRLVCLPLEEYALDPGRTPVRRYEDKIRRGGAGDLHLVAKDTTRAWIVDRDDPVTSSVWEAARASHLALGARHYSLFDFRIDPEGRPWFLEAGLYCSFARTSVVAVMARAAGIDVAELFRNAVAQALLPRPVAR